MGVLVAGFLMQGGAPAVPSKRGEATPHPVDRPVVELDPVTLNLADNSYLKVSIALELNPPSPSEVSKEEGAEPEIETTKATDLVLSTLAEYTKRDLSSRRGRENAKTLLSRRIIKAYHGKVSGIYLTSFVMQ